MRLLTITGVLGAGFVVIACAACGDTGSRTAPARAGEPAVRTPAATDSYQASVQKYREERETALTADTGWLTIAGLFFLTQPEMTFGSDPLNDIVLPPSAPPRAGTFVTANGKVTVTSAPGVTFHLGDKEITTAVLKSDAEGPPDRISLGDLQLWVHLSGGRQSIRLRDRNSPLRKQFTGTQWFPIDPVYRVDVTYHAFEKPQTVQVPNVLGDIDELTVPGEVSFTLKGQPLKMLAVTEGDDKPYWFIFRDLTSGHETYPAARFLYVPPPVNGKMVLDFNEAENPPCAYNPYTTCPLPPAQNRLRVRIEAGEKNYEHR
jgi:uncharacterized protein (DUF1684 family)